MSVIRVVNKFRSVLSEHQRTRVIQLVFMMIVGAILETFSVSLILPFMEMAMSPEETMNKWYVQLVCNVFGVSSSRMFLVIVAITLSLLYLLKNVYLLFEYNIQYKFVYGNMFTMQQNLLANFINRPYEYFLKTNSAEIVRIVNTDTPSAFVLLVTVLNLFTELVVSLALIVVVFVLAPTVTIFIALIFLALLISISAVLKPTLRRAGMRSQNAGSGMNKWLLQSIQGIKEIKVMSREDFFVKQFSVYGKEYIQAYRTSQILSIVPRFFIEAISMGVLFIAIAISIYNGKDIESMLPVVTAIGMAAMRLLPSINRISSALSNISYAEPMLDKMIENLKNISGQIRISFSMEFDNFSNRETDTEIKDLKDRIELHDLTYHYPDTERNVLEDAMIMIKRGDAVGIIGTSGAGKTTTVDVLLGLLIPESGQVLVDGKDAFDNIKGWLSLIGYIPQSIFMLDDSVRSNIAFGIDKEEINDQEVWRALREASLDDYVRSLPEGLDTEIGERGIRLSGGQRQRIGIARALYQNPKVLILDEATSALDNDTEASIMEAIENLQGSKTIIIIAHRMTTIEKCDHVYRVEDGKILLER